LQKRFAFLSRYTYNHIVILFITYSTPMTKTNTKAFTLIELLIVIVIIGILAVALIPRLTGAQATSRDTARKATLQQTATIISAFVNQEVNAPAISTPSAATPMTSTMATAVSGYGNLPYFGPK
jgi:prepilin-type N-terminal cleavage/methylation domain-containing protein